MRFRLIQRVDPIRPNAPKKWYAVSANSGTVTDKTLAKEVAARSSLTVGDVGNAIQNATEVVPNYLVDGKSVQLGSLGTFRLSISSEGTATAEEFTVANIKGVKIIFVPSPEFKRLISEIHFSRE